LEFFDFRLLQQYLPTPDMPISAPKEKSRLTAASQFNLMISDHAAINAEIARGRIALTLIRPANDRCSAAYKPVNVLSQGMEMHVEPDQCSRGGIVLGVGQLR
jgi:hypothetical protein